MVGKEVAVALYKRMLVSEIITCYCLHNFVGQILCNFSFIFRLIWISNKFCSRG